jgi:hypothetical protein
VADTSAAKADDGEEGESDGAGDDDDGTGTAASRASLRSLVRQRQRREEAFASGAAALASAQREADLTSAGGAAASRLPVEAATRAAVQRTVLVLERYNLSLALEARDDAGHTAADLAPTLFAPES